MIEFYAFRNCKGIKEITLGAQLDSIAEGGFQSCTNVVTVYSKNPTPPKVEAKFPVQWWTKATIYVPTGSVKAYKAAPAWIHLENYEEMDFGAGIKDLADDTTDNLAVEVIDGQLVINGSNIAVYSIDGRAIRTGASNSALNLPRGIYIVTDGQKAVKVAL